MAGSAGLGPTRYLPEGELLQYDGCPELKRMPVGRSNAEWHGHNPAAREPSDDALMQLLPDGKR